MIFSNIKGANTETYISLFKCYVRPILEYGAVIYMPHYMYLIDAIEKVQRNFTNKLPSLCNITYLQRLNVRNIERRIKIDLIWIYKILHNLICINLSNNIKLFVISNSRDKEYKLYKCNFRLDVKKYYFCNRVINVWNSLPNDVASCTSLSSFKCKLKDVKFQPFLKGHAVK